MMPENAQKPDPIQTASQTAEARTPDGKFAKGNPGGPGNPGVASLAQHRARFARALRNKDIDTALRVIRSVMRKGKDKDRLAAAKELLNRILGLPVQADMLERIENIERTIAEKGNNAK